jgi:DNA/RNA-binding domain of Phe-tRNA-synthetase-like protein
LNSCVALTLGHEYASRHKEKVQATQGVLLKVEEVVLTYRKLYWQVGVDFQVTIGSKLINQELRHSLLNAMP